MKHALLPVADSKTSSGPATRNLVVKLVALLALLSTAGAFGLFCFKSKPWFKPDITKLTSSHAVSSFAVLAVEATSAGSY